MKAKIYILGIIIIFLSVCIGVCRYAGCWLVKKDSPAKADVIVILMDSIADRVLESWDLYRKELAHKVIIVEENMGAYKTLEDKGVHIISNTKQIGDALVAMGIPADSIIILPGDETSTQMEATVIKEYLKSKPYIGTILLVSSSPHTRRASMIFKSAFRKAKIPVNILCNPSSYTDFDAQKW